MWMMHVDGRNVRSRRQIYFGVTHILYTFASMLKNILIVAVGGAVGSVARYLLSRLVQGTVLSAFPLGTMAVNVAGCLLIGLVCGLSEGEGSPVTPDVKLLLTVGFCGGLTTFSTFMNESLSLVKAGDVLLCALYIGASVALGLLAVAAGWHMAK